MTCSRDKSSSAQPLVSRESSAAFRTCPIFITHRETMTHPCGVKVGWGAPDW